MGQKKPIIIGHRGAMGHETENTLASIKSAIALKVDMIEIDVFKLKNGEVVVFHDDTVDRLTDAKGHIEDFSFEELRKLVVKGGHAIPTLEEVLDVMDAEVDLNIELKGANTSERVNEIVESYIKQHGWKLQNFIISSFRWDELEKMREVNKEIAIAVLTGEDPVDAIPVAKKLNAVAVNPSYKQLTAENNVKLKEAGLKIYPWTVNEPQDIIKMKRFGVDGIITNYPERIN
ncbi:glycerophosphodiester phosphodiesterase [Euzebyella marina]|uniref:Glycerophosphodiester phosphodiesterase n=2 Tax=Euzebyella marina TaxID=1761453 RepID=A0A3G2LC24_9FLAO|nr:glycerophosphodiester phosphodiesterase [Euzebyella marina]